MLSDVILAPRTDAIYNMHGYLTKVPVQAIVPLIEEFSPPSGVVVDMFAGSGMTAIAARLAGRNAVVSDISRLGQHIGLGYLSEVSPSGLSETADNIVAASKEKVGWLYRTIRQEDAVEVEAVRFVWSFVYECSSCGSAVKYYEMMKAAEWNSKKLSCPNCGVGFVKRGAKYLYDEPVLAVVKSVEGRQAEQAFSEYDRQMVSEAESMDFRSQIPSAVIDEDREMYARSALKKWGLSKTSDFFSQRNSAVLYDLWSRISEIQNADLRRKLLFCFTAILPRASKRYQWSPKVPLNAANQNYYIAPVFYEWNVYDLFMRKVSAAIKSDSLIFGSLNSSDRVFQEYVVASADNLGHLDNNSVDYIFTDPPFGSNIFYSDMNLFQEAWLGNLTDHASEAVVRTTGGGENKRVSSDRYKELLTNAFSEAFRVLKPGGVISIVFGNSKGSVWSLAQEAFREAGFRGKPVRINILDKGQRSVKGLASGREGVTTLDLVVSLRKENVAAGDMQQSGRSINESIHEVVEKFAHLPGMTASHLYLEVLRQAIYEAQDVSSIDLEDVLVVVNESGYSVDAATGHIKLR